LKGAGKRVVIIGCGKVGISLGVLLSRRGWKIEGVFDPVVKNAKQAARIIKHTQVFRSLGEMPAGVEVVLLAVPDDTIGQAAQ
jgi:predicted dehydrogenase